MRELWKTHELHLSSRSNLGWLQVISDHDAIRDHFNQLNFFIAVCDYVKMIMKKKSVGPVWLMQYVGMF